MSKNLSGNHIANKHIVFVTYVHNATRSFRFNTLAQILLNDFSSRMIVILRFACNKFCTVTNSIY